MCRILTRLNVDGTIQYLQRKPNWISKYGLNEEIMSSRLDSPLCNWSYSRSSLFPRQAGYRQPFKHRVLAAVTFLGTCCNTKSKLAPLPRKAVQAERGGGASYGKTVLGRPFFLGRGSSALYEGSIARWVPPPENCAPKGRPPLGQVMRSSGRDCVFCPTGGSSCSPSAKSGLLVFLWQ